MNSTVALQTIPKRIWQMPIVPESYDRHPLLSDEEREALTRYVQDHAAVYARPRLARLERPLMDVMHLRSQDKGRTCAVRKVMFEGMFRRGTSFWAWSYEDWCTVLQPSSKLFLQQHERHEEARLTIMDAAYLLGGFSDLQAVGQTIERALKESREYVCEAYTCSLTDLYCSTECCPCTSILNSTNSRWIYTRLCGHGT